MCYYVGEYTFNGYSRENFFAMLTTNPELFSNSFFTNLAKIHRKYEKLIYGSVVKVTTPRNEDDAKLQAFAVLRMMTAYYLLYYGYNYGQYDGYYILSYFTI